MNTRAVVTGSSGHLGFHVARAAIDEGLQVDLLVRRSNQNVDALVNAGATCHIVDLESPASYQSLIEGADVLFHVAAANTTETDNPSSVLASTVGLADKVLRAAVDSRVGTTVYTSSVVVLGRSRDRNRLITENDRTEHFESPYVRGKAEGEKICERLILDTGADIRRVYPSWLVGPNDLRGTPPQKLIGDYLRKGQPFYFDGGISIASVQDVARAHIAAWKLGAVQGRYVLGGNNVTFKEFFDLLAELTGRKGPRIYLPKPLLLLAARILKSVLGFVGKRSPVDPAYIRSVVSAFSWYDSSKAEAELGYQIRPVREILQEALLTERKRAAGTQLLVQRPKPQVSFSDRPAAAQPALLLTGVPGWLGNRFVDVLMNGDRNGQRYPDRKVHLLIEPRQAPLLDLPDSFKIFPIDLTKPLDIPAAFEGVSTAIHLAGAIYPSKIDVLYKVNADGTKNLVDACVKHGVRRFLYMSTDSVCGHGTNGQRIFDESTPDAPYKNYGKSKWMAEQYVLEKTRAGLLDGTILRGFWFFGPFAPPRQKNFLDMMRKSRQIVFGNGKNYRSISHVDNTIDAFLKVENAPESVGKFYWIGDEKADYTVDEIYSTFCEAFGNRYRPLYIPAFVCSGMRLVDTLLGRSGALNPTVHGISKFDFDIAGRVDAAKRDFHYKPKISLREYARELALST